jgi:predicted ribosome quality control (RQC) complex YloA/Tae2 family protein
VSLTVREIELLALELQPIVGAIVQRAFAPEPRVAVLELRKPGESLLLLLCAEPGRTRLHLVDARPTSPPTPHAFQGLLRAELTGLCLDALEALPGERLAMLRFKGRPGMRTLACELTGRHGNLFLLDERGIIRGSAVPNLSERRDNAPGQPYLPPLARGALPENEKCARFAPLGGQFGLSQAVAAAYAEREHAERVGGRRRALLSALSARRARLARTLEKVREDVARTGRAEEHRRRGELLKANLKLVQRGLAEVRVTEYGTDGVREVAIRLDPALSPKDNLEREFRQYRRLTAGQARATARLEEVRGELAAVEARERDVSTMDEDALFQVPAPAPAVRPGRRDRGAPSLPYREYRSRTGQRIRAGRGAQENDALTFRLSKGNDVWLHVRGIHGAHVVVPLERDEPLTDETLLDAALLAAHHSDARGQLAVDVAWTRVKYVRKVKGSPGAVTFSQDKTVLARQDGERIAQLLASAGAASL